ncbi:DUF389 domain-containing protein [Cytophagaceae bacterium ABcell3]|nr:DUF389 domain-containing protein [Cytophagaceae bacterium ABcell3]
MARELTVTASREVINKLISDIEDKEGLLSISLHKEASIKPPGDILIFQVTNNTLNSFMRILENYNIGGKDGVSLSTSEPDSVITNKPDSRIAKDGMDATWEEAEMVISKDSNMNINTLFMMAMSGVITMIGVSTSTIHVVIGGMLVAPGFMPIMRIPLGLVTKNPYWYYGIKDTFQGYFCLMLGATLTTFILWLLDSNPLLPEEEYYQLHNPFVDYWTSITLSSVFSSAAAVVVAVLLLATKRTIFTSGVMVALALIPSACLIPVCLISGEFELAGGAALRFGIDVALILGLSYVLFQAKQRWEHRRTIKL